VIKNLGIAKVKIENNYFNKLHFLDYSNPVSFNSYNNSEIHNNTNSDKEKDKETETENTQSNKKMKISDKVG
jgi:hypothetical protein